MASTAGELKESSSSFEWKIKNFASLSARPGESYESPSFDFCNATWCILLYPNGWSNNNSGCVSAFLKKLNNHKSSHIVFQTMSIKTIDGNYYIYYKCKSEYYKNTVTWEHRESLKRSKIQEITDRDGALTFSCTVSRNRRAANAELETVPIKNDTNPQEPKIFWKTLVRNLKDSFLQKRNCDVIIKVKEQEFAAHRMILGLRSIVFAAMFEHDMSENRNGILEIDDTEPSIFRDFLLYLYCGEVEKLSFDKVYELYALSDKYDTKDLKQECVKFMECNLSVETVCDVFLLAEKYSEKQLNELATIFVFKNANAVLPSDQWAKLEIQRQLLANQILKSIVLDKASNLN